MVQTKAGLHSKRYRSGLELDGKVGHKQGKKEQRPFLCSNNQTCGSTVFLYFNPIIIKHEKLFHPMSCLVPGCAAELYPLLLVLLC